MNLRFNELNNYKMRYSLSHIGFLDVHSKIDYENIDLDNEKVIAKYELEENSAGFRKRKFKNKHKIKLRKKGQLILFIAVVGILYWCYLIYNGLGINFNIVAILKAIVAIVFAFFIGAAISIISDNKFTRELIFEDTNIIIKNILGFNRKHPVKEIFIREVDSKNHIFIHSNHYLMIFKTDYAKHHSDDFFKKFYSEVFVKINEE